MQFILKQEDQRPDLGSDMDDYWNQRSISLGTEGKKQFLEILNQVIIKKKQNKKHNIWSFLEEFTINDNNRGYDTWVLDY